LSAEPKTIEVSCGGNRTHTVHVEEHAEAFHLWAVVVTRGDASRRTNAALEAWKMNRYRELIGFKPAEYGRIIGESWVPKAGLTPAEWDLYVNTLAHACDRLEYLWTGRDVE
jgi:hypothetical protein